jgi:YrbI family 3-deoxy-D-manno-octulosonate 8-phosphate phosphatase
MFYSPDGEIMKRFTTRDGMGMHLLNRSGIKTGIMTSENSPIVTARAKKLKVDICKIGIRNKKQAIMELSKEVGIPLEEFAYIGDDVNDENPIMMCGVGACPSDAVPVIQKAANYICHEKGGYGAVREFCEMILQAQNLPIRLPDAF